jgi:hypothetical protein
MSLPSRRTGLYKETSSLFSYSPRLMCRHHKKIQANPYEMVHPGANRGLSTRGQTGRHRNHDHNEYQEIGTCPVGIFGNSVQSSPLALIEAKPLKNGQAVGNIATSLEGLSMFPAGGGVGEGMWKDNLCGYNKSLQPLVNRHRKETQGRSLFMKICFVCPADGRLSISKTKAGTALYRRLHV